MRIQKNVVSFLAAGLLLVALPGAAGAPKIFGLPNALGACSEEGIGEGSYANGSLSVRSFDARGDDLIANVDLSAACKINDEFRGHLDTSGTAAATLLENTAEHVVFSLSGTTGAKETTFVIESSLELVPEKGETSVVKRINHAPSMSAAELATMLNRYLGVR